MRVSFLGVGNMGAPLAMNILQTGEQLTIYTSRPQCALEFAAAGAIVATAIKGLADCDLLCTCLPLPSHVVEAVTGENGLYRLMRPGSIHLEFSTIAPKTALELKEDAAARDIAYVQATVLKTPQIAAKKEEPLFVGGDSRAVSKLMPLLEKIGKPIDVKTIEASCAVKLLSNMIGMANIVVLAEGMRIGSAAGMEPHELLNLLMETGAASFQMKVRGPKIASDDYSPLFSIDLAIKDLRLGCEMAAGWGCDPKVVISALDCLEKASAQGLGKEDVCAVGKI